MTDDDTADDAAGPPPVFDLSSPATGRFRRARSIEAAAIAGVAYSLLTVVALIRLSRFPDLSVGEAELTAWYDDDAHQVWLIGALSLAAVGSIAFLWFVAVIRRRLGDREDRFFATVFLSSGIAYVAVWLVGAGALAAPAVAMTQLDGASVSPGSATLAGGISGSMILVVAPRLQAVFVFSTSTVILRSRVLPSWLAIVGYVSGLMLFVVPLVTQPVGLAFPVWVFIVSVVMMLKRP
jgi:hypothetical protein